MLTTPCSYLTNVVSTEE
jgi:hypothetical protein